MVKAKECCCGCTLRTGTLILLWISLITGCLEILSYLATLLYPSSLRYESGTVHTLRALYFLIVSLAGTGTSFLGIYGIQKNMPQYLTGAYYYFCYDAIYLGLLAFVAIVYPSLYYKISMLTPSYRMSSTPELILVLVLFLLFLIALTVYFAIIVKSLRESMIKQRYSGGDSQIPADPSALGYNAA